MKTRLILIGVWAAILVACSAPKMVTEPTILTPLDSHYTLQKQWQIKTETMPNRDSEGLFFAEDAHHLYVASATGYLVSLQKKNSSRWTDQVIWESKFSAPIVSGPAKAGSSLFIGTAKGQLIAISTLDGHQLWQTQLSSEVMSYPLIIDQRIITRTVDGKLYAVNITNGDVLWVAEHQMPSLSLRGAPAVIYQEGTLYVAWESGTVQALSAKSGALLWETRIAVPKGRTDLERMVDIQARLVIQDNRLFALGFHGKLVSINPENGNFYFVKEVSGYRDFVVDDRAIYVVDDEDIIHAFDLSNGTKIWRQEAFKRRLVGDLNLYKDELLVVDGWGYVHWINKVQGIESSRFKHSNDYGDGNRILRVKVEGTALTLLDDEGVITRYSVKPSNLAQFKAEQLNSAVQNVSQETTLKKGNTFNE